MIDIKDLREKLSETLIKMHPQYQCCITGRLMRDPAIASDGHNYEFAAIKHHLLTSKESPKGKLQAKNPQAPAGLLRPLNSSVHLNVALKEQIKLAFDKVAAEAFQALQAKSEKPECSLEDRYRLALCYTYGLGVEQNKKHAVELYERLVSERYAGAFYSLGICFREGDGVEKNLKIAVDFLEQGVALNFPPAKSELAYCCYFGIGVQTDSNRALRLYQSAAYQEYPQAEYNLGIFHQNGLVGPIDQKAAAELIERAAWKEYPLAVLELGRCYLYGRGRERDPTQGLALCFKASWLGCSDAQYTITTFYQHGPKAFPGSILSIEQETAVEFAELAALQGNGNGLVYLGESHEEGFGGLPKSDERALAYFIKAAEAGNLLAQRHLGSFYRAGRGGLNRDPRKALEWFLKVAEKEVAAEKNNTIAIALFETGTMLSLGEDGINKDPHRATGFFRRAAQQGHAEAQFLMGDYHRTGQGVAQDSKRAAEFYQSAADQGHMGAQYQLGLCYELGIGFAEDVVRAFQFYENPAKQGQPAALHRLGRCYLMGLGVKQNKALGTQYIQQAADKGYALAQYEHGKSLASSEGREAEIDHKRAIELLTKAAAQRNQEGSIEAIFELGICHFEGRGVEKRFEKAMELWQEAADGGMAEAAYWRGLVFEEGLTGTQDASKAFGYYNKAAEQGHVGALFKMGIYLKHGRGVTQNNLEAFRAFKKAASKGHAGAARELGDCYQRGVGCDQDEERAQGFFKEAARLYQHDINTTGNPEALYELAHFYEVALGDISQDFIKAGELYKQAAEHSGRPYAKAQSRVGELRVLGLYGFSRDPEAAGLCFSMAAGLGNPQAKRKLGIHLLSYGSSKTQTTTQSAKSFFELFKEAEAQGDVEASYYLGICYEIGLGTSRDLKSAVEYYQKAAALGHVGAKLHLGFCYAGEGGLKRDDERYRILVTEASSLYPEVIKKADPYSAYEFYHFYFHALSRLLRGDWVSSFYKSLVIEAQCKIGLGYQLGHFGFPKDKNLALFYFRRPENAGNNAAKQKLGVCLFESGDEKDHREAFTVLQELQKQGDAEAAFYLGQCYKLGKGTERNLTTSVLMFGFALHRGNPDVQDMVKKRSKAVTSAKSEAESQKKPVVP